MAAQVQTGRLLFHCKQLCACVLLDLRDLDPDGSGILEIRLAEEIELPLDVVAAFLLDAVDHNAGHAQQRLALKAHAVERSGADEVFDRAAVELPACHAAAEILKAAERPVLLSARNKLVYEAAADAFYRNKAEADIVSADGEVGKRLVDIRRQQFYAHLAAFGDVLGYLGAVIEHRREQRGHILARIVFFHVRRAVGYDRVAHRVRLVEGVGRKVKDLVIDAVCYILGNAALYRAIDAAAFIAVDEGDALGVDDLVLFLAHRAADHICLAERKSGKAAKNFNSLLLIDDAAVGDLKYRAQKLVLVAYLLGMRRALDKSRDAVHRAGAVKGYDCGDVFNALGLEAGANAGHAGAFKLENAACMPLREHFENLRIAVGDLFDLEIRLGAPHHFRRVLEHREVSQTEKVHLEKPQLLERRHLILRDDRLVVFRQRNVFINGLIGYYNAGCVHARVARHALERFGNVDEPVQHLVALVHVAQGL